MLDPANVLDVDLLAFDETGPILNPYYKNDEDAKLRVTLSIERLGLKDNDVQKERVQVKDQMYELIIKYKNEIHNTSEPDPNVINDCFKSMKRMTNPSAPYSSFARWILRYSGDEKLERIASV